MANITAETAAGVQTLAAADGRKLVLVLEDAGVDILHRCGGKAKCTTCRVEVLDGDAGQMGEAEQARLAVETGLPESVRLSCQVRVAEDLHVRVINQASVKGIDAGPRPSED